MNLTEADIQQTYDLLDKLYVKLESSPDLPRGLTYLKEQAMLCRAMLDQVHDLRLKVGRSYSWVQEQLIYRKSQLHLAGSDQEKVQTKQKIAELEALKVSHGTLFRLVQAQGSVLNGTNRDIRLLADVTLKQMKLGDIDPSAAGKNLMQEVGYADMAEKLAAYADQPDAMPLSPVVLVEEPEPAPLVPEVPKVDEFAGLFVESVGEPMVFPPMPSAAGPVPLPVAGAMTTVGFDAPVTAVEEAPRGVRVANFSSVPFESVIADEALLHGTPQADAEIPANRAF